MMNVNTNSFKSNGCNRSRTEIKNGTMFKRPILDRKNVILRKFQIVRQQAVTKSLITILKPAGPNADPGETPAFTTYKKQRVPEIRTEGCLLVRQL